MFDPVEFYQFAGQLYQQKSEREVENRIIIIELIIRHSYVPEIFLKFQILVVVFIKKSLIILKNNLIKTFLIS